MDGVSTTLVSIYVIFAGVAIMLQIVMIDSENYYVVRHGAYRGVTLAVLQSILFGIFWLPVLIMAWIRGLIRGD